MAKIPYSRGDNRAESSFPALHLTKKNLALAAALSKSVRGLTPTDRDGHGNRKPAVHDPHVFYNALQRRARRNADSQTVMRIMPDLELSKQILTSSILSPQDMASPEIIYTTPKDLFGSDLNALVLSIFRKKFKEDFKINALLADMLGESLFEKGSYPVAVIPENALDAMINGIKPISMESYSPYLDKHQMPRSTGVLGSYKTPSTTSGPQLGLESHYEPLGNDANDAYLHYQCSGWGEYENYVKEDYISVTDNPAVLLMPKLADKLVSAQVVKQYQRNGLKTALEAQAPISDMRIEQAIFSSRLGPDERVMTTPHQYELSRKTVGNPLVMKLPSEAVIPIHSPNNPKDHKGYFIVIDEEGHPIEMRDTDIQFATMSRGGNGSVASNLMQRVKTNVLDTDSFDPFNQAHMRMAHQVFGDLIERDLISRLRNGGAKAVAVARNEDVYRLMLSRIMQKRHTQLLYIPKEYMTYIAFYYTDDGIGQSLLDRQSQLNMLRSVLFFSELIGSVKNSIGRTKVQVNLDPTDPNPMKTLEHAMDEIVRSRTIILPNGMNPQDTMEFIQRAGFEWDVKGHPELPETSFEFVNTSTSIAKPDSELQDRLRRASIMALGLSPETVDNGFNAEFATTAVANNILLAKRVILMQDLFTPQLSDHLRKLAANTESLVTEIKELLEKHFEQINLTIKDVEGAADNIDEQVKRKYIVSHALHLLFENFTAELPRPVSVTAEAQLKEVQDYDQVLDMAINSFVSPALFFRGAVGEMSAEIDNIKAMFKSRFMRKWLAEKGIATELSEMLSFEDDDVLHNQVMRDITKHTQTLSRLVAKGLIDLKQTADAVSKDLKKHRVDTTGGSSTDSGGGGGFGGFGGGGGSFGGGLGGDTGGFSDFGADSLGGDLTGGDLGDEDTGQQAGGVSPEDLPNTAQPQDQNQSGGNAL